MARAIVGVLLTALTAVPIILHADTVQLSVRDGRVSLVATNATPAQIFEAWSKAGGIRVVNAERMPSTPITLRLENVPEEQALDTILRPVAGYLAQRRAVSDPSASVFDRILILATPAGPRPAGTAPAPASPPKPNTPAQPVFPQAPPRGFAPQQPAQPAAQGPIGIPQAPGVTRLVGPDGQPVEDDQAGAPAPAPYTPGDAPDARPIPPRNLPPPPSAQQPAAQAQQPVQSPGAPPVGVPVPGMVVPGPPPQTQTPRR